MAFMVVNGVVGTGWSSSTDLAEIGQTVMDSG